MATVPYVTTSPFGGRTSVDVGELRTVSASLHRTRDAASALANSASTPNFSLLEGGDFGVGAGSGGAWFTAINGLCIALDGGSVLTGLDQLDKGA